MVSGVQGGLYRSDRTLIPEGLLSRQHLRVKLQANGSIRQIRREEAPIQRVQQPAEPGETKHFLSGSFVYAGLLFEHFGHFLLESLARLWFIERRPDLPILWVAAHRQPGLLAYQEEILELLGIRNPVHVLTEQSAIEELIVPGLGYRVESEFAPEQQHALKAIGPAPLVPGKRVWLSRRGVANGRFLNERVLEQELESRGWILFQPEAHRVRDQLHFLCDAERIAGIAGSAHHLLVLMPDYRGRVSVFPRGRTISGDFLTIANALRLDQTIHFAATVNCTPGLPSWLRDLCWTDLNAVLASLGETRRLSNDFLIDLRTILAECPRESRWGILSRLVFKRLGPGRRMSPELTSSAVSSS